MTVGEKEKQEGGKENETWRAGQVEIKGKRKERRKIAVAVGEVS
jgi:hypothetical protein